MNDGASYKEKKTFLILHLFNCFIQYFIPKFHFTIHSPIVPVSEEKLQPIL